MWTRSSDSLSSLPQFKIISLDLNPGFWGFGARIGDSVSLAESILEVLNEPKKFQGDIESIKKSYVPDSIAAEYEKLFARLMGKQ